MKKVRICFISKAAALLAVLVFAFSFAVMAQTNYYVSASTGNNSNNGLSSAAPKATIQAAVSAAALAGNGAVINIANGTYTLTATLNLNAEMTIIGQSEAGVIIDGHTIIGGWILNPNRSNTTLSNFTVIPNGNTNGGYPIHAASNTGSPLPVISNISLSHITINGSYKTPFDCNGVTNLTLSYLTANNAGHGNGVQVSGCWNVNASHLTTSNNAWGGFAVYVSTALGRGSDHVSIDAGSSSFSEPFGVYIQDESGYTSTNVSVNGGYDFTVQNPVSKAGYTYYFQAKATALAFAAILPSPASSSVKQLSGNQFTVAPGMSIQAAINAAKPGDVIYVYPGNYIESAPGSTLYNGGTYVFGLFLPAAKPGISIVGVDGGGVPVSASANVVANVQLNATNNFGPSGVFVEGDNVSVSGLNLYLDPSGGQNKTVEVIGENFTLKYSRLSDGNSLYINDWRFNTSTNISHITKYWVEGNRFEAGTSMDISDGAGFSGPVSGRNILNNYFDAAGGSFAMVSFNGSGTGVPWFVNSVGGAVITGNRFVNGQQYIRHRGTLDNSQFNWSQYWNNNSFDKAVITLADETAFTPRAYTYTNGSYHFNNVKRIGAIIQADISNVAQNGDLVKIGAGTYTENITVTKGVEIRGNGEGSTKIIPAVSNTFCGSGSLCAGASNVFLVQASNVTIDQLAIDGDNPALTSGKLAGGADIDARNGIITDHTLNTVFNNLYVHHVTVKNIYLRAIYASSGGTFLFDHNTVSNVQADGGSIALFNFGGSGSFTNNTVSDVADGIVSNWSTGSVYTGNTVSNAGSGIHTDNNGGSGGTADLIQNNTVVNSPAGGYGIWVFAPYLPVQVKNNTVTNVEVGLMSAGQQLPVTTLFSGNTVDGQGKANTTGVYVTTDLFGYGTANSAVDFFNNNIINNTDGFYLESESGRTLSLVANNNSISHNSNSNVTQGTGASGAGTFAADMNCNWWGSVLGSVINTTINGAAVTHTSWLANGTDADLPSPGFQPASACASAVSNAQVTAKTDITCFGSANGTVTIGFANGIGASSYSLDGGSAVAVAGSPFTVNGLAPGSHTVVITDEAGNTASVIFSITEPALLVASSSATPIVCNGTSVVTVNVAGGKAPYSGTGTFTVGAGTYTYTVTDANGCTATTTVTPTVIPDTEKPTVTAPAEYSMVNDPGKCGATITDIGTPVTGDNCGVASITNNHPSTYYPVGTTMVTWIVTDYSGNVNDTAKQSITVIDNEVPVIKPVANQWFCKNAGGLYSIPVLEASDNCSVTVSYQITGATARSGNGNDASGAFNPGTSAITWSAADPAGHVTTATTVVTITALPSATITASNADNFCNQIVLTANTTAAGATYQWLSGNAVAGTGQQLSLGQLNGDGIYTVTVTANGCTGAPASYHFQKQVLAGSYTILALKEMELGESNTVATGSVGVTASNGKARFHKNSSVSSPGSFVKAKNIEKSGSNIVITDPIYAAATGISLPTMYFNTANTHNLPNKDVPQNSTSTVNGNYKNLTLKKGSNTILTGNTFGTILVEQGARVSFTATTVNMDKLEVAKGPRTGYSYVRFAPDTKVLVSGSVNIGSQVYINPDNNKVTFYLGDKKSDDEKFTVKGGDTKVTANIYMPNGTLKVTGGYRYGDYGNGHGDCDKDDDDDRFFGQGNSYVYMTGLFIAGEVESNGKNVVWNSFDCSAGPVSLINYTPAVTATQSNATQEKSIATSEEDLKVTVMPNPSTTYFTLKLESKYASPVDMRVMDGRGRVIDAKSRLGSNSTVQIGFNYSSGTYYAELIQGTTRKVVQLVKIIN